MELRNHYEEMRGTRVLVLGGLGFIGHNLVKTLVNEYDCAVICLDNGKNASVESIAPVRNKVRFVQADVRALDTWKELMHEVDYVFHLACIQVAHSHVEPMEDLDVNARCVLEMLEYIRRNDLRNIRRFVYTSSCSVYGYSSKLPVAETDPVNPLSHYAATKYLGETYTLMYNMLYDVPTASIRYSNVYGYGQSTKNPYCGVLGKFIDQAIKGDELTVIGDGEQTRDYTFIDDAIDATILSAVHPKALGAVFNVATCRELTVNGIVHILKGHFSNLKTQRVPERHIDNIRRRVIDIEKIRHTLGWNPKVTVEEGIELTIKSLQEAKSLQPS
ncbi:NAD-dependent epimerase/dehydratase family protein [Flaviaesturariibacter amylovorans]|uniref:SDR family oxidoreductase n=1 Tax=Flaviaesturariibacter amylovorans TaxID=1084520 RepID=A0ABP8GBS1_9BACT